jgi:sugar O-acyltransferase (sialic acid O-acetyltransferase NeuD family)
MQLLIYGARAFARTVADLARDCGHEVLGMVDDEGSGEGVLGRFDEVTESYAGCGFAMGIGYNNLPARWAAWQRVRRCGRETPALVHPRAYVARSACVGAGSLIMAGAIVDRAARLGEATVVWPGACISHDVEVEENCFVSPNATLCGFVHVGAHSFIGAAAAVADRGVVPANSFLKMQAHFTTRSA